MDFVRCMGNTKNIMYQFTNLRIVGDIFPDICEPIKEQYQYLPKEQAKLTILTVN